MESTLPNTIVPFNPSVGSGLAGNDGYGITGTPENYQRLGATLNLSRATSLTNLEINNLFAKPTVVAIAQGNSTPTTARYPNTVTNGDFLLRGNSIATVVGDGLDEFTTWTFNLTRDPDFIDLTDTTLLASAELTLTLKPTFGINTDGITIQGLGSIVKPIRELEAGKTDTITIDLLDYFSPDTVVQAIQANGGQLSVTYQDDAIVSFAQLELKINHTPKRLSSDFNGDGKDDVFIRSPGWAGLLVRTDTVFQLSSIQSGWMDGWISKVDQHFVGDFNGDDTDDLFVRSPESVGLLAYNGNTFQLASIQSDWIDGWNLSKVDQHFVGDFNGDSKDDVFIRSPEWAGLLTLNGTRFQLVSIQSDWINGWNLSKVDQHFVGDFTAFSSLVERI